MPCINWPPKAFLETSGISKIDLFQKLTYFKNKAILGSRTFSPTLLFFIPGGHAHLGVRQGTETYASIIILNK